MRDLMNKKREKSIKRKFGSHLTSIDIFNQFILPDIKKLLLDYIWIDLYAGENLDLTEAVLTAGKQIAVGSGNDLTVTSGNLGGNPEEGTLGSHDRDPRVSVPKSSP